MLHLCRFTLPLILICSMAPRASAQQVFDLSAPAIAVTDSANPTFFVGTPSGLFSSEQQLDELRPLYIAPVGGPQPLIVGVQTDGGSVYVRSTGPDQLWRSDDAGATWTLIMDGLPTVGQMSRLYVLPVNPTGLLVRFTDGDDSTLYRSNDRGSTWTLQSTLPVRADKFSVNLNNPDIMFTATGRQIWRSLNGGEDWARVSVAPFPAVPGLNVAFIFSDPLSATSALLGVGGGRVGTRTRGIYRSADQGQTWTSVLRTVSASLIYGADWPYIFHKNSTALGHIDISSTRGLSWRRVEFAGDGFSTPQDIAIDPRNDRVIYLSSGDAENPFYRSEDGGDTWARLPVTVLPTLAGPTEPIVREVLLGGAPRGTMTTIASPENPSWEYEFTVDEPTVSWLDAERVDRRINLTFNSDGLGLGEQRTQVVVRSNETINPEFQFDVVLRVVEAESSPFVISTVAGSEERDVEGDGGPALEAGLGFASGMAVGPDGSIYMTIGRDNIVRRVSPDGVIDRFAGTGEEGFAGDGGPALQAQLDFPIEIVVGNDGTVYFRDLSNRRIRKVDPRGNISTFASNGEFSLGVPTAGPDATQVFINPDAMTVDRLGNIIVADRRRLYRLSPAGGYETIVERMDFELEVLTADEAGNFYGVTEDSQVMVIRPNGDSELFAGMGEPGFTGDGGPATLATLNEPDGLAAGDGMVFIADTLNHVIRVVAPDGLIRSFAGTGAQGFSGDGGPALTAELSRPHNMTYLDGRLYVLDRSNRRVRVIELGQSDNPQVTQEGVVNAAGFKFNEVSPGENISIFGLVLAIETAIAQSTPLPVELVGTRVTLTDSSGATRPCRLFFVAALQINCNVDGATTLGAATLTVETANGGRGTIHIQVVAVAPGLFSANATGAGVAAAVGIRIAPDGAQSVVDVFDASTNPRTALPIDLGPDGEQVVLLLFGTGFRGFESSVEVTIGGQAAQVVGVAAQGEFVGLDQVNVIIPRSLIGAGEVEIRVVVDGKVANVVTVRIG